MTAAESLDQTAAGGKTIENTAGISKVEMAIGRLRNDSRLSFLVEVWQSNVKAFEMQRSDVVEELRRLRSELTQIISMSLIFEGVVLTAVAQTKHLNCSLVWSPMVLAIFVAAAACVGIVKKQGAISMKEEELDRMDSNICATINAIEKLYLDPEEEVDTSGSIRPPNYLSDNDDDPAASAPRPYLNFFSTYIIAWISFFSVIVAIYSYRTLCRHCLQPCGGGDALSPSPFAYIYN